MTRPEPVRADTFDLQASGANGSPMQQLNHVEAGFDGLGDEEEDPYDDQNDDDDDDDDDGDALSSSPSIPDDDIDFDFMYALHSFAATVEGQANATKGDMLVLLDDSNSYWWLVRIVRDHTVGYLPAETIETPQERLARLNKHRNIDLTAIMLEDHSPTSRSSSRKPFRRKGAKGSFEVDSSDDEAPEDDTEDFITDSQLEEDFDDPIMDVEPHTPAEQIDVLERRKSDLAELDELIDPEPGAQESSEMGTDTLDVSDYGGHRVMRLKDLTEQVGERPTSAIFRDANPEPLKISMTPSIARDRTSMSPVEGSSDMASTTKTNLTDREKEDSKRSLSISSTGYPDTNAELDIREREKDKKGRKNSVFGNLFKKKQKKSSRDEDNSREQDAKERKSSIPAVHREANDSEDLLRNDWTTVHATEIEGNKQSSAINQIRGFPANSITYASPEPLSPKQELHVETPTQSVDADSDSQSPATVGGSTNIQTPSLPWSDASLHSFLDNDTSIRDVLVLIHEGSRLRKRANVDPINPQIADLYSTCAIHIEEMSSHLDDVLVSYLFDMKA